MLPNRYDGQNCAIARALEVVGERWTLLVVRDALLGVRRFQDFQTRLEISRPVLTDRLGQLVDHGVLERIRYQRKPDRFEYVLTERGRALWPVIASLAEWGEPLTPGGAPRRYRHQSCESSLAVAARCPDCGQSLTVEDVVSSPAPGAPLSGADHIDTTVRTALSRERRLLTPIRDSSSCADTEIPRMKDGAER